MKVFIGYDSREDIAYKVCKNSILKRTERIEVYPLIQSDLRTKGLYSRGVDVLASTEFTFTRFLVPELVGFSGWALFMDCDMILQADIAELFAQVDDKYAVMCVKHDYNPEASIKMDGKAQTVYPRKNWSSVMLFNCGHPSNSVLTKDLVNKPDISGAYLHRFSWLSDDEIGDLSQEWNWLVGHYHEPGHGKPKLLHYTEGGPWFENYVNCEYSDRWIAELADLTKIDKSIVKPNWIT